MLHAELGACHPNCDGTRVVGVCSVVGDGWMRDCKGDYQKTRIKSESAMMPTKSDELTTELMTLAKAYCKARDCQLTSLGQWMFANSKFFPRLAKPGARLYVAAYDDARQWFADNWPIGTPWPAKYSRPKRTKPVVEAPAA
jgi:hypothetical protein